MPDNGPYDDLTARPLRPDWPKRVRSALDELDRRSYALRGASVVYDPFEDFVWLLRVAQGDELPEWKGPPLMPGEEMPP